MSSHSKADSNGSNERITSAAGIPVVDNKNSISVGMNGPLLLQDYQLLDKMSHFDRERIPERVVHAQGSGAHGYFEVTKDISHLCKAKFLGEVGKKTPILARFSTVGGERGSSDSARDPRGFALKFYTEEGNWDMVGNNTPVFFIRDPIQFPDFIHTQKRNPQTDLKDPDMFWDFLSLVPESIHQVTILFSDRGTPKGYRHMNGYGSHTFKMVNKEGDFKWVKFHFKTDQGIENFTNEESVKMTGENPDYAKEDLFNAIKDGNPPSWTFYIQVMDPNQAKDCKYNPFDVTKVWPHSDFPLQEVGKLVLDRNHENYFAEIEQAAFNPASFVPGIEPSPDKMLQGRLFSYHDTHIHRLGVNYTQIPVNCPYRTRVANHYRDGFMAVNGNGGSNPNYFPNSCPKRLHDKPEETDVHEVHVEGKAGRYSQTAWEGKEQDDYVQAGDLYRIMDDSQKERLISNIVNHLGNARKDIQERMIAIFKKADQDYGSRVEKGLTKA